MIKTILQLARAIDRANQRSLRERAKREREMERARAASAREDDKYRREMERVRAASAREDDKHRREMERESHRAQKAAIDAEKNAYEMRRKKRELLRMSFLKKIKKMEG